MQSGDAVRDGILDERLQEQRRNAAAGCAVVHVAFDLKALAEAHLLDPEEAIGQRELVGERNLIAAR